MQAKKIEAGVRRTTVEARDAAPEPSLAVVSHTTRSRPVVDAMAPTMASSAGHASPAATPPILVGGRDWIAATRFVPMNNAELAARLLAKVREHVRDGG